MSEHHITVKRTARYFTLGPSEGIREIWFVLHGQGQLAERFIRDFRSLDDGSRLIVAPEALSRFYISGSRGHIGACWMTKEDRLAEIDDYVRYLDQLYGELLSGLNLSDDDCRSIRVILLGFSQGAAAAGRWACYGTSRIDELVLWGGMLPPDLDRNTYAATLRRLSLTLVVGDSDRYITPEQKGEAASRLENEGLPYRWIDFQGGHHIDNEVLVQLTSG